LTRPPTPAAAAGLVRDRTAARAALDEALLEMEKGRDYLVYRDAQTDRVAVLVRRRDGDFDLVEA
jgi:hypothetical protein